MLAPVLGAADSQVGQAGLLPHEALYLVEEMDEQTQLCSNRERSQDRNMVGETDSATLGGSGQWEAALWPDLGVGTRGNKSLLGEEEGGTEQGLRTIKERRKLTVARWQRALEYWRPKSLNRVV